MSILDAVAPPHDEVLGLGVTGAMYASRSIPVRSFIAVSKSDARTQYPATHVTSDETQTAPLVSELDTGAQVGTNFAEGFEVQSRATDAVNNLYSTYGKRILDVTLAGLIGLLSLPAGLLAALLVRMDDGHAALFRQQRLGRGGQAFTIFKLRSMSVGAVEVPTAHAAALPITRAGRFLRRTSLDEIPQLWNVIRGDMSLVGPRPALASQTRLRQMRAASGASGIRPGLTGLAQVNGYDGMSEQEKAGWDAEYAASVSLIRDISILMRTVLYLLRPPPRY